MSSEDGIMQGNKHEKSLLSGGGIYLEASAVDSAEEMDVENDDHDNLIAPIVSDIASPILGESLRFDERVPQARPTHRLIVALNSSPANSHTHTSNFESHIHRGSPDLGQLHSRSDPQPMGRQASEALSSMSENPTNHTVPSLQPKKRGRPKGWRPGQSYAELKGGPQPRDWKKDKPKKTAQSGAGSSGNEAKKRGRPPKAPELSARHHYLQSKPNFKPFGCEWHESGRHMCCPAELQNMDTLRKHVYLIHGGMNPLICRWKKCAKDNSPVEFADKEAFRIHMEKVHLEPYTWHMGDGIQNRGISMLKQDPNKLPAYLFDDDGNQVTPSVNDQQFEDTAGMLERKRKLRDIRRLANENAPDEREYVSQMLGNGVLDA
jgi:hypothetical protein